MARLGAIRLRLARFSRADIGKKAMAVEALAWLALTRAALVVVPFPRLARFMGEFVSPQDPRVALARARAAPEQAETAATIGRIVLLAANAAPFRAVCLPQALAARAMLSRRGVRSVLYFGAARGEEPPFDAHAWLDAAGVEVTGYPLAHDFTGIACFV
jgi:Transglutaminase-like superfamily